MFFCKLFSHDFSFPALMTKAHGVKLLNKGGDRAFRRRLAYSYTRVGYRISVCSSGGYLCLGSGVDSVRHIAATRIPHRGPASIFVQQQMFCFLTGWSRFAPTISFRFLLRERPPVQSPKETLPFPGQWQ